jgi:DNA-binding transcriptional MerR regulator
VTVYRIGTAARLSGIDAMTLRNWERRYGVVVAARGPGRQRVYSLEDIDRLRWLRTQVDAGLSASEAHTLLRERLRRGGADFSGPRVREEARQIRARATATRGRSEAARERLNARAWTVPAPGRR